MSIELSVLPVPFTTYVLFRQFLAKHGFTQELHEVVDRAINEWMASIDSAQEEGTSDSLNGYQWKSLFLPEGTKLRVVREGAQHLAHVVECQILFDGRAYSPSQFAEEVHGSPRNAWKTIWLLRPGDEDWRLANEYRRVRSNNLERIRTNQKK